MKTKQSRFGVKFIYNCGHTVLKRTCSLSERIGTIHVRVPCPECAKLLLREQRVARS